MEREQLYHLTKFTFFSWESLGANSLATTNMAAEFAVVLEVLLDDTYASLLKLGFQFKERIIVPITGDYLF